MMTILIHWTEWLADPRVEQFAHAKDAHARADGLSNDRSATVFEDEDDFWRVLSLYSKTQLAEMRNAFSDGAQRISSFPNKEYGIRNVADCIRMAVKLQPLQESYKVSEVHATEVEMEDPEAAKLKAGRKPRQPRVVGKEFKPVRAGTSLSKIIESVNAGGKTVDDVAADAGIRPDQVLHRLRHVLGVNHGVDHKVDDKGHISLILPHGKRHADLITSKPVQEAAE
jgi:hypothetical protein